MYSRVQIKTVNLVQRIENLVPSKHPFLGVSFCKVGWRLSLMYHRSRSLHTYLITLLEAEHLLHHRISSFGINLELLSYTVKSARGCLRLLFP
jgi:hypothetical protein